MLQVVGWLLVVWFQNSSEAPAVLVMTAPMCNTAVGEVLCTWRDALQLSTAHHPGCMPYGTAFGITMQQRVPNPCGVHMCEHHLDACLHSRATHCWQCQAYADEGSLKLSNARGGPLVTAPLYTSQTTMMISLPLWKYALEVSKSKATPEIASALSLPRACQVNTTQVALHTYKGETCKARGKSSSYRAPAACWIGPVSWCCGC